ncbi:MAG: hypothetical protein U0526_03525 [Candidatus Saccharibacteria bacterium]
MKPGNMVEGAFGKNPPEKISLIILDISDDEVFRRLAKRGRADDTEAAIRKRLMCMSKMFSVLSRSWAMY